MNKELLDSMQKQMIPSPEVREALSKKLARPVKNRTVPWMKYGVVAACAALVIGGFLASGMSQKYTVIVRSLQRPPIEAPLHSYVTVEGLGEIIQENTAALTGGGDTGAPNTGDLPGGEMAPSGALVPEGDIAAQEEAVAVYQKLMDHFDGYYPKWYGGAYIDRSGYLVVQLVEEQDPGDKTLELQVLDWTESSQVMFSSCKYSLAHLNQLMDQLNRIPTTHPYDAEYFAGWGIDEARNRIEVTLTEADPTALSILASLDPDDDAIYVQVGQRASADVALGEDVRTDSAGTEDPAVHHVMPGGATVPDDKDLIAEEPWSDGARYDLEKLPEELPQQKQPIFEVQSVPEEDIP